MNGNLPLIGVSLYQLVSAHRAACSALVTRLPVNAESEAPVLWPFARLSPKDMAARKKASPDPCRPPVLSLRCCAFRQPAPSRLQVRPGKVELSADGRSLEVHYEVRAKGGFGSVLPPAPAVPPPLPLPATPQLAHHLPARLQSLELATLPNGEEVVQTTKQGVKR